MSVDTRPTPKGNPISSGGWPLKTNVLYAVGGMGIFHACQFGVIILLAKFAPPDVLGQVRYALAIATPVVVFCSFELRGAFVADTAEEFTFGVYRRLRSTMMMLAGAILLGVVAHEALSGQTVAYTVIFAGMCASKIVLSLAEIGWGLFQKRERLDLMAGSAALRGVAMLGAFALFVPLYYYLSRSGRVAVDRVPDGAAVAITLYVLASAAILLAFDRPRVAARPDHNPRWNWPAVRKLARQTFPLGLVLLILHLCNSIPELVIVRQVGGKTALGYFGALATVTLAGNLVVLQAATAAANRISRSYQADLPTFFRLAGKLLGLAVTVAAAFLAVALLWGEWLLGVLYLSDYAGYYDEFRIIVVAQCLALLTTVFGVLTTQMRLFWLQVPAQVIVLLSTIVAALVFIPQAEDPVRGGAWTLLVRSAVHVTLYAGCVLTGIILRPRLLRKRVSRAEKPPRPAPPPTDTTQEW